MKSDNSAVRETFAGIMDEFGPSVYRLALSLTGDAELANDIYQQTFLLLLEKQPRFSHRAQLRVWLMSSARKISSAELRRADNSKTVPIDNAPQPVVHDSVTVELCDFLRVLGEKYREVAVLFYIEDMSIRDIASALGISAAAVKTRLSRARCELQKIYKEELM